VVRVPFGEAPRESESEQLGLKGLTKRKRTPPPAEKYALVLEAHERLPPFATKSVIDRALPSPLVPAPLVDLARWIGDYYLCPPGTALGPVLSSAGPSSLVRLGLGKRKAKPTAHGEASPASVVADLPARQPWTPTPDQATAIEALQASVREHRFAAHLLWGITGSGKTAVFLEAARTALEAGRQVLFLVPEIGLTPQTVARIRKALGEGVAVLHSQLTDTERAEAWDGLRTGRLQVALGPRSALFAPLFHLGLVIVDEEHDGSYKQNGDAPRYHGRDAAVWLARRHGVPVILGSATPSLETWNNALEGRYGRLDLRQRATGASLPPVDLVDLRHGRASTGATFSGPLRQALVDCIAAGSRAMVLHNRRGYAPQLACLDCGHVPECPDCPGLRLTLHRSRGLLSCHHCGLSIPVPATCPECGSDELDPEGWAIQRVEEELHRVLPETPVTRLDRDVAADRDGHATALASFQERGGVLLGTQMIAKGHDFPEVTLAAVTDSDIGSGMPDFRAAERTFQLLSQFAGRAGRAGKPGRVLLQTRRPEDPLLARVAAHDFEGFASEELARRRELSLPPFGRMVLVEASSEDPDSAGRWLGRLAKRLAGIRDLQASVLGPVEAPLPVVRKRHRQHLLLKASPERFAALRQALMREAAVEPPPKGVRTSVDVDPVDLL
jgi:primosomal protein N' (replication factor Y)